MKCNDKVTGVPEHHVIKCYSKNGGKTPSIPILHRRSRYVVNFTFQALYPGHTLDRKRQRTLETGKEFVAKVKIPASTKCRTPVARPVYATSLSGLAASYHNLHLSVNNKSSNSVATLTINPYPANVEYTVSS